MLPAWVHEGSARGRATEAARPGTRCRTGQGGGRRPPRAPRGPATRPGRHGGAGRRELLRPMGGSEAGSAVAESRRAVSGDQDRSTADGGGPMIASKPVRLLSLAIVALVVITGVRAIVGSFAFGGDLLDTSGRSGGTGERTAGVVAYVLDGDTVQVTAHDGREVRVRFLGTHPRSPTTSTRPSATPTTPPTPSPSSRRSAPRCCCSAIPPRQIGTHTTGFCGTSTTTARTSPCNCSKPVRRGCTSAAQRSVAPVTTQKPPSARRAPRPRTLGRLLTTIRRVLVSPRGRPDSFGHQGRPSRGASHVPAPLTSTAGSMPSPQTPRTTASTPTR